MLFRLFTTTFLVMVLLVPMNGPEAKQEGSIPSSRYMGGPAEMVTAPNGAIVNKEVLEELPKTFWTEGPEIENPVEGVYVLGGYLISACIVVEADEGLIVFDTGDTKKDGEKLLAAIRTFSDKPIKAIVYGHTHYCFGAGVLASIGAALVGSGMNTDLDMDRVGMTIIWAGLGVGVIVAIAHKPYARLTLKGSAK